MMGGELGSTVTAEVQSDFPGRWTYQEAAWAPVGFSNNVLGLSHRLTLEHFKLMMLLRRRPALQCGCMALTCHQ